MTPEAAKEHLLARRAELDAKLHKIEASLDQEPSKDFEDRATEREDDEVKEGLGNAGLLEIRQIDAALGRIEDGVYGECARCGNMISPDRLAVVPTTAFCRNCA
ncbi:MAG: TraR/DksA C4-type zinc finger protein [Pseudomonadota bacterium]